MIAIRLVVLLFSYGAFCLLTQRDPSRPSKKALYDLRSHDAHALIAKRAPPTVQIPVELWKNHDITAGFLIPTDIGDKAYKLLFDTGSSITTVLSTRSKDARFDREQKYPFSKDDDCPPAIEIGYRDGSIYKGDKATDSVALKTLRRKRFGVLAVEEMENTSETEDSSSSFDKNHSPLGNLGADAGPLSFFKGLKTQINFRLDGPSWVKAGPGVHTGSAPKLQTVADAMSKWTLPSKDLGSVLIDTGTGAIHIPDSVAASYFTGIAAEPPTEDSLFWEVSCKQKLPTLRIELSGEDFDIPGSKLIAPPAYEGAETCLTVISSIVGNGISVLGLPFILQRTITLEDSTVPPKMYITGTER